MTHRDTTIYPSARLNLILGPNGTGKSSFVAALALGLGGSPAVMERATDFYAYIRHTAPSATISIDLVENCETGAKRTIQHHMVRQTKKGVVHTYKIDGKAVSKKDLDAVVHSYGIAVDNLCYFLPQEKISKFTTLNAVQLLLETEKALAASSGFVDVIEKQPGDGKGSSAARGVTLHDEHQALIDKWKSTGVAQKRLQGLRKDMEKYRNVLDSLQSEKEQMERYERVKSEREVLERVAPLVAMRETRDQRDQLKEEHKLTKAQLKAAMIEVQRASEQSKLAREAQEASKKAVMKQKHIIKTLQAEVGKSDGPVKEAASKLRQLRASLKEQLEGKARKEHELTVAQAKLDDAVRELESQRSMEEHKEAIKKVRAMLTKLRQEMNESDARLDKLNEQKVELRQAEQDAQSALKDVVREDETTMDNLRAKSKINILAGSAIASMEALQKVKGLDTSEENFVCPMMNHIWVDERVMRERAGIKDDAPYDQLQRAQKTLLRMFESIMAVGDLTSTVVRHKEQWTAVSNTKVSFGMNRGKTVKDRRIGVIETKPEPFDGGAAAGGAAAASSGSSSSSSSSSSAAAGGAAGGGDGTRHDSWALIRPELQEQLRSIGFRTAWEDVIDGHELARGVLRDRLRSVLVAFNKGALQKAEQVPAATESSISIVQALPAGVTLLTPEGFLATKGDSFSGQTVVRNGSLKPQDLCTLFPRVSRDRLASARQEVQAAYDQIAEFKASDEVRVVTEARKKAHKSFTRAKTAEEQATKAYKATKKLLQKKSDLESTIEELKEELEQDEQAEVQRIRQSIRKAQLEFFTSHAGMLGKVQALQGGVDGLALSVAKLGIASAEAEKVQRTLDPLKEEADRLTGKAAELKTYIARKKDDFYLFKQEYDRVCPDYDADEVNKMEQKAHDLTVDFRCRLLKEQGKAEVEVEAARGAAPTSSEIRQALQDKQVEGESIFDGIGEDNAVEKYKDAQAKLASLEKEEQAAVAEQSKEAQEASESRIVYESKIKEVIQSISAALTRSFEEINCKGHVELVRDEDVSQYGAKIMVSFRAKEAKQALSATTHSGGERAVSTVSYLLALQKSTACPFRVVDEMNQGMDASNERAIFKQIMRTCGHDLLDKKRTGASHVIRTASQEGRQYFVITPKLLPDLAYDDHCRVHVILNGTHVSQPHQLSSSLYDLSASTLSALPAGHAKGAGAGAGAGMGSARGGGGAGRKRRRGEEEEEEGTPEPEDWTADEVEGSDEEDDEDEDEFEPSSKASSSSSSSSAAASSKAASQGKSRRTGRSGAATSKQAGRLKKRARKEASAGSDFSSSDIDL